MSIPIGSFMMGALPTDEGAYEAEKPQHKAEVTQPIDVCAYPCTQGLYESIMGKNPSDSIGSFRPVDSVSWCDAVLFCIRLSEREGLEPWCVLLEPFSNYNDWSKKVKWNKSANGYRLPTEAEWEYCARSGEKHLYAGSDNMDEVAWYWDNAGKETHPVGEKKANGFGLYDMSGNVWEWGWDSWTRDYESSTTDPVYVDVSSPDRVDRGGSWDDVAWFTRVSRRGRYDASRRSDRQGFRFLRTVP